MTPTLRTLGLAILLAAAPVARAEEALAPVPPPSAGDRGSDATLEQVEAELEEALLRVEAIRARRDRLRKEGREAEARDASGVVRESAERVLELERDRRRIAAVPPASPATEGPEAEFRKDLLAALAAGRAAVSKPDPNGVAASIDGVVAGKERLRAWLEANGGAAPLALRQHLLALLDRQVHLMMIARAALEVAPLGEAGGSTEAEASARTLLAEIDRDLVRIAEECARLWDHVVSQARRKAQPPVPVMVVDRSAGATTYPPRSPEVEAQDRAFGRIQSLRIARSKLRRELDGLRTERADALEKGDAARAEELRHRIGDVEQRIVDVTRGIEAPALLRAADVLRDGGLWERAQALHDEALGVGTPEGSGPGSLAEQVAALRAEVARLRELVERRGK